jgi:hypothetical protein
MIEVASLHYGVIFKKAFSNPAIFKAFVKDFLDIQLDITDVETEKSFDTPVGSVDSHFDLFAEDKKNRIIVDIQHVRNADHYHRFLHYHCSALLEQVVKSKDYRPKLEVYTIVVLTSGDKHKKDICTIDFDPVDRDGIKIGEINHKIIYLCPKYVSDDTPEPFREWLRAIDDSLDEKVEIKDYKRKIIKKIFELIKKDKTSPREYAKMKDEYSDELVKQRKFDEGIKKGEINKQIEIAKNLLDVLDNETIALKTGLRVEEVQELRN